MKFFRYRYKLFKGIVYFIKYSWIRSWNSDFSAYLKIKMMKLEHLYLIMEVLRNASVVYRIRGDEETVEQINNDYRYIENVIYHKEMNTNKD